MEPLNEERQHPEEEGENNEDSNEETISTNDEEAICSNHGGYTYWKRDIKDGHLLPSSTPQKIDETLSNSSSQEPVCNGGYGPSAWNRGGTWEERNVTTKVSEMLNSILVRSILLKGNNRIIEIDELSSCTGEANVFIVRRQARLGYDYQLVAKYNGIFDNSPVSGSASIPEFADYEPNFKVSITQDKLTPGLTNKMLEDAFQSHLKLAIQQIKEKLFNY